MVLAEQNEQLSINQSLLDLITLPTPALTYILKFIPPEMHMIVLLRYHTDNISFPDLFEVIPSERHFELAEGLASQLTMLNKALAEMDDMRCLLASKIILHKQMISELADS